MMLVRLAGGSNEMVQIAAAGALRILACDALATSRRHCGCERHPGAGAAEQKRQRGGERRSGWGAGEHAHRR